MHGRPDLLRAAAMNRHCVARPRGRIVFFIVRDIRVKKGKRGNQSTSYPRVLRRAEWSAQRENIRRDPCGKVLDYEEDIRGMTRLHRNVSQA